MAIDSESCGAGIVIEIYSEDVVIRAPPSLASLSRVMQNVTDNLDISRDTIRKSGAVLIESSIPILQDRIIDDINES